MQWNARTQYACLAAVELARHYRAGLPVQIKTISERLDIPSRFLVQILLQLKSTGWVNSTRGAAGGYQLTRAPSEISIWDIMQSVDSSSDLSLDPTSSVERVALKRLLQQAQIAYQKVLQETSLAQLLERIDQQRDPMYFI
ncbi:MAG: Rrf2 family transcriptional regulator [Planctomycetaceae bacterium]|nr:Rrf2 family transcriptional regulator [Planctomycetaceae bacterium]